MSAVPENAIGLTKLRDEVDDITVSEVESVPIEFFSSLGKTRKIINNADAKELCNLNANDLEFSFKKPLYVTSISVVLATYESVKGLKLIATDSLSRKEEKVTAIVDKAAGNTYNFLINAAITSFKLSRGESPFNNKKINQVQVFAIQLEEIEKFENEFTNLEDKKSEVLDLAQQKISYIEEQFQRLAGDRTNTKTELNKLSGEASELTNKKTNLDALIKNLNGNLKKVETELETKRTLESAINEKINDLTNKKTSIESEIAQKTNTLAITNRDISEQDAKLKKLISNVNVFAEEFSVFVQQGNRQVLTYLALAIIPLILLCVVVINLFNGAVDLTVKFDEIPNIDLLTLLSTRLPFVIIAGLIVALSVKLLLFLTQRIIAIHQQRLDLAKIAIIAKDVSDASGAQLNMSAKELYESKTYLKMSVLRAYLADQISSYKYEARKAQDSELPSKQAQ